MQTNSWLDLRPSFSIPDAAAVSVPRSEDLRWRSWAGPSTGLESVACSDESATRSSAIAALLQEFILSDFVETYKPFSELSMLLFPHEYSCQLQLLLLGLAEGILY